MITVKVRDNEAFEKAFRRFTKACEKSHEEGEAKRLRKAREDHGHPHENESQGDDDPCTESRCQESTNDGEAEVSDKIPCPQEAQLLIAELKTILHGRKNQRVGHTTQPVSCNGRQ